MGEYHSLPSGDDEGTGWVLMQASVRGARHLQSGAPNQDAIDCFVARDRSTIVLTAADGHGGGRYVRSGRGAQLAVSIARATLSSLFERFAEKDHALATDILHDWRRAVQADLEANPLSSAERDQTGNADATIAYGTTLLAAAFGSYGGVVLQLGDGDIFFSRDGSIERAIAVPVLPNEATYSLCMADAADYVQVRWLERSKLEQLSAITIATDGFIKSFRDDKAAAKQLSRMSERLRTEPEQNVTKDLEKWLCEVSAAGSGDDISLAMACRKKGQRPARLM